MRHVDHWMWTAVLAASLYLAACDQALDDSKMSVKHDLLGMVAVSPDSAADTSTALRTLGMRLFLDERLSSTGKISCATCHQPEHAFAEPERVSHGIGLKARRRNTPSLLNIGHHARFNWDGEFASLATQLGSVFSRDGDMGQTLAEALPQIRSSPEYRHLAIVLGRALDEATATEALVRFQESLLSGDSRFDRFLFGGDSTALSPLEKQGWELFHTKAACGGCHEWLMLSNTEARARGAAMFTDQRYHNLGIGYEGGRFRDVGRYKVDRVRSAVGRFKTPSLRNVELTAPYMHDGSLATLEDVVDFYRRGGRPNPTLSTSVHPVSLTENEKRALVAFLKSLTGSTPRLDRAH